MMLPASTGTGNAGGLMAGEEAGVDGGVFDSSRAEGRSMRATSVIFILRRKVVTPGRADVEVSGFWGGVSFFGSSIGLVATGEAEIGFADASLLVTGGREMVAGLTMRRPPERVSARKVSASAISSAAFLTQGGGGR